MLLGQRFCNLTWWPGSPLSPFSPGAPGRPWRRLTPERWDHQTQPPHWKTFLHYIKTNSRWQSFSVNTICLVLESLRDVRRQQVLVCFKKHCSYFVTCSYFGIMSSLASSYECWNSWFWNWCPLSQTYLAHLKDNLKVWVCVHSLNAPYTSHKRNHLEVQVIESVCFQITHLKIHSSLLYEINIIIIKISACFMHDKSVDPLFLISCIFAIGLSYLSM